MARGGEVDTSETVSEYVDEPSLGLVPALCGALRCSGDAPGHQAEDAGTPAAATAATATSRAGAPWMAGVAVTVTVAVAVAAESVVQSTPTVVSDAARERRVMVMGSVTSGDDGGGASFYGDCTPWSLALSRGWMHRREADTPRPLPLLPTLPPATKLLPGDDCNSSAALMASAAGVAPAAAAAAVNARMVCSNFSIFFA